MNALLGSLIGDAIGGPVEFYYNKEITDDISRDCVNLSGGGVFNLGQGQITDDGEMTLTLLKALYKCNENNKNLKDTAVTILEGYSEWLKSKPFDKGHTCSLAIITYSRYGFPKCLNFLNKESQANGALMRASAVAAFGINCKLSLSKTIELSIIDSQITHPNQACKEANAIYTYSMYHLLKGISPCEVLAKTTKFVELNIKSIVKSWYLESVSIQNLDFRKNIGHVRWGFTAAYYFLRNSQISYIEAMTTVLKKGGDTDTNCCIVGGLVACYQEIPKSLIDKLFLFDCTQEGNKRPVDYSVKATFHKLHLVTNK